jgi:hypothetical protein
MWLMPFKEIIADYAENHTETHKYKMPDHLLLKELVDIITTDLKGIRNTHVTAGNFVAIKVDVGCNNCVECCPATFKQIKRIVK